MFGICLLSLIAVRKEPSSKSEMTTQVLFGELMEVLETKNDFCLVRLNYDKYEGWVSRNQIYFLPEPEYRSLVSKDFLLTAELVGKISDKNERDDFPVLLGSSLPGIGATSFMAGPKIFSYAGMTLNPKIKRPENIRVMAYHYLGAPYLWGGKSPFGIDCSGFVQMVYFLCGYRLPRDAWQQAEEGQALSFPEEAAEGDLAFFNNKEGKISHVGIILKNNRIIHASGSVRIDKLDHQGIYNEMERSYSHHLRIIKKII
jgi:gamma-D-glutamyl-L-lysine dipeptidyl-peptidase